MSRGIHKPSFECFCKSLINEQDRLIASGQLSNNKSLMGHSKKIIRIILIKILNHITKDQVILMMLLFFLTSCLTKKTV